MTENSVKIGPLVYSIVEVADLHDETGKKSLLGDIQWDECRIQLEANAAPQLQRVILWHEILHGILNQHDLNDRAERIVAALAWGIAGALQDNPWLREAE